MNRLTNEDFSSATTREELLELLQEKGIDIGSVNRMISYTDELEKLQIELVKLQTWIKRTGRRVAILFEGRDAAGKGGTIKRFREHLNPRSMRVVALSKPNEVEMGQWYFRRYIKELPNAGEMVFFDRSWYNRAVVEPVMGFCTNEEYHTFMKQVTEFEHMLHEDGVDIIKFWFSITKDEQKARFDKRLKNPLKQWKFSPVDQKGQELWSKYTHYKEQMFGRTHTPFSPWIIIKTNNKKVARLEAMRYVLSYFNYTGKEDALTTTVPDPNIVFRYHRSLVKID